MKLQHLSLLCLNRIDRALHVERTLRLIVMLTVEDLA